jgi:hypothetical protein
MLLDVVVIGPWAARKGIAAHNQGDARKPVFVGSGTCQSFLKKRTEPVGFLLSARQIAFFGLQSSQAVLLGRNLFGP